MSSVLRVLAVAALIAMSCGAPVDATRTASATVAATPTATASVAIQTKPPEQLVQPQLPLVTSVRWAVDRNATGIRLILYHTGYASSFEIVDQLGASVMHIEIAGSGIFGDTSCVTHNLPGELVTWRGVFPAQFAAFEQEYRTYRVVAAGIPTGQTTLPLIDSGCRGTLPLATGGGTSPLLPASYDLPSECHYYDNSTAPGARWWKIFCPVGLPSNYLRPSLAAQGWIGCDTKVWKRDGVQLAVADTVNTLEYNAILDERPLASSGCVTPTQ